MNNNNSAENAAKEHEYEDLRKRIIDELVPENIPYDESKYVHTTIDHNWDSGRDWHDVPRLGEPITLDQSGIARYNKAICKNGRIVVHVKSQPISKAAE